MTRANAKIDVTVVSGPTSPGNVSDWELFFARRALAKLKSRLGQQGLLDLLAPDIDAATETMKAWVDESEGKWRPAEIRMRASGLSSAEFLAYFHSMDEPKMLAAQPEHFVVKVLDGAYDGVENMGPNITRFDLHLASEDQAVDELLADHPTRMVGYATIPDGTVAVHLLHQFRDTDDGFDVVLGVYFPAAAPEELIEAHRQHLAVEFTNWIIAAGESLGRHSSAPVPLVAPGA